MTRLDKRPALNNKISVKDFSEFYWLKEELIVFCRKEGLGVSGSKMELASRIKLYLKTGQKNQIAKPPKLKANSKFDWNNEKLSLKTIITDNYKNTENVRDFFSTEIGPQFKFNVKFMNWMKLNVGSTLGVAIAQWSVIKKQKKLNVGTKDIAAQFEYNTYLRDFLADNPNSSRAVGIKLWKIKKTLRGHNKYVEEDLKWLDESI